MKILFDTNAFLAFHIAPEALGAHRSIAEEPATARLVSAVVGWEIAIKSALGRLELPASADAWVTDMMAVGQMTAMPVEMSHALAVAALPPHHRDPFDRLLIATAHELRCPILTSGAAFDAYDVETLRF